MHIKDTQGFTLIEILIAIGIFAGIAFIIGVFIKSVFDYQLLFTQQLSAQQEIEYAFSMMLPEMRSMTSSVIGEYAIAQASSTAITFFTDVDANGSADRVRYFLDGTILRKGIIRPSGNPPVYDSTQEVFSDVAHSVVSGTPIFSYYDEQYTGSEPALTEPIKLAAIRLIGITLSLRDPNKAVPVTAHIEIVPRNLRTNL